MDEIISFLNWLNGNDDIKEQLNEKVESYFYGLDSVEDSYRKFISEEIIPLAQDYGFDFDLEDYIEFLKENENTVLSEKELSNVAGGKNLDLSFLIMPTINFN